MGDPNDMRARPALLDLANRCEASTRPDRALDADIAAAVRAGLPRGCDWAFKYPKWEGVFNGEVRIIGNANGNGEHITGTFVSPKVTASLDAAMTLIADNYRLHSLGETPSLVGGPWLALLASKSDTGKSGISGHSPALALCAAALRARASVGTHPEGRDGEVGSVHDSAGTQDIAQGDPA